MTTLKDIAEKAGVSISAVSRVYTEGASVSPKKRALISKIATEMGYHREVGIQKAAFQLPTIALQVTDEYAEWHPEIFSILQDLTQQFHIQWLIGSIDNAATGCITIGRDAPSIDIPTVTCLHHNSGNFSLDYHHIGQQAAEILLASGFNNIGFLGLANDQASQQCLTGFRSVLDHISSFEQQHILVDHCSIKAGKQAIEARIKTLAKVYFCVHDALALGARLALNKAGLQIPKKCALLSIGSQHTMLSHLQAPIKAILTAAVQQILDGSEIQHRTFSCRLQDQGTLR